MRGGGIYWIASYPKSGNTWIRIALSCLCRGGQMPDLTRAMDLCPSSAVLGWMETIIDVPLDDMTPAEQSLMRLEACRLYAQTATAPAFLKVHDAYDAAQFPPEISVGTILIVRDPRDVAPSWADHMGIDLDGAIERMACPDFTLSPPGPHQHPQIRQYLGSWSGNVLSWLDVAPGPKLLLRYEDMLAAPIASFTALARFTGLAVSPDLVQQTVAATSFQALQAAEALSGFGERLSTQKAFFRQGQAGAWQKNLSAAQAERLWNDHHHVMARLGYSAEGSLSPPLSTGSGRESGSAVRPPDHRPGDFLVGQDGEAQPLVQGLRGIGLVDMQTDTETQG